MVQIFPTNWAIAIEDLDAANLDLTNEEDVEKLVELAVEDAEADFANDIDEFERYEIKDGDIVLWGISWSY